MQRIDPKPDTKQAGAPISVARLRSESLLKGQSRLVIVHNGDEYVLRVTRQGKLILTK